LTSTGERVQGWMESDGALTTNGPYSDLQVPVGSLRPAVQTRTFSFDLNLNASSEEGDTFTSAIEVYDSLGRGHVVTVKFERQTDPNNWNYTISTPDATDVTGTLQFNQNGTLVSPDFATPVEITIPEANGAGELTLN